MHSQLTEAEKSRRNEMLGNFFNVVGLRYRQCRMDSFEVYDELQRPMLEKVKKYCESLDELKQNLVLFGPPGTGKDHIAVAVCFEAMFRHGLECLWINGSQLFSEIRDAISHDEDESCLRWRLMNPALLVISDMIPPEGKLTEFQLQQLYLIVDERYRRCRPIITTLNTSTSKEARDFLGPQIHSRLKQDCVAIHCNWPDYRTR